MSLLKPDHVYSYSQLSSFDECPYGFYLQRIERVPQKSNAFAEQGTLIHELIDEWAKGNIPIDKLPEEYEKRYAEVVVSSFPRMLAAKGYASKAFNLGLTYFKHFQGFPGYEIIDTETSFTTDIDGRPFVGVVDMVMRDQLTDDLIVLDHKSKSLSTFKKNEKEMYRQQYLYAKYIYEKYGVWPDRLMFNLFKEDGLTMEQPFDKETYDKTLQWATDIIHKIEDYQMIDWLEMKEKPDFFCQEICSSRGSCSGSMT